ncbi:MAG TPA: shikimate dehydrogenase, partial [Myxococcales bacterium]|nr:shikimate dehydrogenase [Myxococcales bacterium]
MRALYVLIGDPVAHSRSPAIHARAFQLLGVDAVYAPCRVTDVPGAVRALRSLGIAGANVTIPHKQAVIPSLDRLEETARRIGAVNCIASRDGVLHGHNTDREGILRALGSFSGRAVVLGAGGSARAAVDALRPQVTIVNRTRSRGEELAREMGVEAGGPEALARAEVVVNCTSVGMSGEEMPIDPAALRGTPTIIDLAYSPRGETALIRAARAKGLRTIDGIDVLVQQAIASLEIWLERPRL